MMRRKSRLKRSVAAHSVEFAAVLHGMSASRRRDFDDSQK